ncbi:hypothetical protein PMI11_00983 [Rhizobium sp. CF142]|nr:hypothetical protein PMI11_00983 [Rhizobium sp. CF142]
MRSASSVEYAAPPSVLPDISPTRGEIESWQRSSQTTDVGRRSGLLPISPLVGEMSGRTEGGVTLSKVKERKPGMSLRYALSPRSVSA